MKKSLFPIILPFLLASFPLCAQVSSGHSVVIDLLGAKYSYETPIGGDWSLVSRVGLETTTISYVSLSNNDITSFEWYISPQVTLEPRFYTNIARRQSLGRPTEGNSADYISFGVSAFIWDTALLAFTPEYGIRRNFTSGGKLYYELSGGLGFYTDFNSSILSPRVQFKFGIRL